MSLIRNNRNRTDQTLTAKRFVAGQPISGSSWRPVEYIQVNKGYFFLDTRKNLNINSSSSVVIKAELAQDATGYLMGTPTGLQIQKSGNVILWKNGSTTLFQTAWKPGPHLFGFTRTTDGTIPYYDGENITVEKPVTTIVNASFAIGILTEAGLGSDVTGSAMSSSGSWAYRIYEVIGNLFYSYNSIAEMGMMHWYATRTSQSMVLYETRYSENNTLNMGAILESEGTKSYGDDVTYGMQADDLRVICNSPYNNLLMILSNDGGPDRKAGWKPAGEADIFNNNLASAAETFIDGEGQTHKTAFYIPADIISGVSTVNPPYGTWETGQLFRGRKPKWNLWNNALRAFKHLKRVSTSVQGQYGYKLQYNIFKDCYGRNFSDYVAGTPEKTDPLGCFDGYDERDSAAHIPFVNTDGVVPTIGFYGNVNYAKSDEKSYDHVYMTYYYDQVANGTIKVCLGNLPWWNFTRAQLDAAYSAVGHTLRTYGIYASIDVMKGGDWLNIAGFTSVTPIRDSDNQPVPFCSAYLNSGDADVEAARQAYQETGVNAQLNYGGTMAELMRYEANGDLYTRVNVRMANTTTITNPEIHTIDCSDVFPAKLIDVKLAKYDEAIRLIGDTGGIVTKTSVSDTTKDIFLKPYKGSGDSSCAHFFSVPLNSTDSKDAFGIRFALVPSAVASPQTSDAEGLFENTRDAGFRNPKYLVYASCTMMQSWAYMLGAPVSKVHTVEKLPSTGSSGHYYVDIVEQKIYHRKLVDNRWTWVEDPEVHVNTRPAAGDTDKTYTVGGGYNPWRYGEDGNWHELTLYYKQGNMRGKYSGWAQPFCRYDMRGSVYTDTIDGFAFDNGNFRFYTDSKSVEVPWLHASAEEDTDELKNGAAIFYLDHLMQSGVHTAPSWGGRYEPSAIRYQVFEAANAPHSYGPCAVSNTSLAHHSYVSFINRIENYMFFQNQNETGYRYAVVGDDDLIAKGSSPNALGYMINAHLRLFDGNNVDKTQSTEDFKPFYLSVYKQLPCRPAVQAAAGADNYTFDDSFRITPIFEDKLVSATGGSGAGSVTVDGKTYSWYLVAPTAFPGAYPDNNPTSATPKSMILNPMCFTLQVTTLEGNIEPGAKYLYRIAFA